MATKHSAMLFLPDALHDAGLNFRVLSGWDYNQQGYYWTDRSGNHHGYHGKPLAHYDHHTVSSGYTPNVSANGKTKANFWLGLARPGTTRLYADAPGIPIVVLASSGPANYGNGAGQKVVMRDYYSRGRHFAGPARSHPATRSGTDDYYANRYALGTEAVHMGDGTPLHQGVWELWAQYSAIIGNHFGWTEWNNVAHEDSTRRKIDPKVEQGAPYTERALQDQIAFYMSNGTTPPIDPPPVPEPEELMSLYSMVHGDGFATGARPGKKSDVINFQLKLRDLGHDPGKTDGLYGDTTAAALVSFLGAGPAVNEGRTFTGRNGYALDKAFAALQSSGGGTPPSEVPNHEHGGVKR